MKAKKALRRESNGLKQNMQPQYQGRMAFLFGKVYWWHWDKNHGRWSLKNNPEEVADSDDG